MTTTAQAQQTIIGSALKGRYSELKSTYDSLAQKTGLSINTVKAVLDGKFCNSKSLLLVTDALGWSVNDLISSCDFSEVPASQFATETTETSEATDTTEATEEKEEASEEPTEETNEPQTEEENPTPQQETPAEKTVEEKIEDAVEKMEEEEVEIL